MNIQPEEYVRVRVKLFELVVENPFLTSFGEA